MTTAGDGGGLIFSLFPEPLLKNRPRDRSDRGLFCHRKLRELYEANSTNPASMEAGEYGLTRGTCFIARRLEVVAVAGLLWISWCVLGGVDFLFYFSILFFFERRRPTARMRPPCLMYFSTSTRVRTGCHH